jgi:hypothetical protein
MNISVDSPIVSRFTPAKAWPPALTPRRSSDTGEFSHLLSLSVVGLNLSNHHRA